MTEVCYNFHQMLKANSSIVFKEDIITFFHTLSNSFYKIDGSVIFETFEQ